MSVGADVLGGPQPQSNANRVVGRLRAAEDVRPYPDFVGELTDGRLFAVEYKGEHLRNAKDTLEKDAIGRLWAAKSGGKCLYATVFKSEGGLDVKGQLDKLVANE